MELSGPKILIKLFYTCWRLMVLDCRNLIDGAWLPQQCSSTESSNPNTPWRNNRSNWSSEMTIHPNGMTRNQTPSDIRSISHTRKSNSHMALIITTWNNLCTFSIHKSEIRSKACYILHTLVVFLFKSNIT